MSGGSQHNPNGRQAPLGPAWNPLQMASYLARAPQAHLSSERGVTWHTPTPPPRVYHVPVPSPPEPLQAMKVGGAAGPAVFRHSATPPDLFRHTPTPPDKHMHRHTPSPGDAKAAAGLPPADLYSHLGQQRDKMVRAEDMLSFARSVAGAGVDLSLARAAPAPSAAANGAPLSLSVRDAPTINSLIARAQPRHPPHHARVDQLLERLVPSPVSPHSVIVHSRAAPTPSPPSSNEDSADSCGAPPGSKRKRKPDRTVRVPVPTPHLPHPLQAHLEPVAGTPTTPAPPAASTPPPQPTRRPSTDRPTPPLTHDDTRTAAGPLDADNAPPIVPASSATPLSHLDQLPFENGDTAYDKHNGPDTVDRREPAEPPHTRRKTRSGSAETIDDIAAMIASTDEADAPPPSGDPVTSANPVPDANAPVTIDSLKSVLGSVDSVKPEKESPKMSPPRDSEETPEPDERSAPETAAAVAPRRRSARSSNAEANVPVESPSEARAAEGECAVDRKTDEPVAASFVEVENQLQKMFAGLEEEPLPAPTPDAAPADPAPTQLVVVRREGAGKRKRSATKGEKKATLSADELPPSKKKATRKKTGTAGGRQRRARPKEATARDAYDSGSNASGASRSRGPYIQIRGPRDSPLSVNVVNAAGGATNDDEYEGAHRSRPPQPRAKHMDGELRNGLRTRGLHCSTLSLRYDATTPDATWVCAFCERGPHAGAREGSEPRPLGDLFGPYTVSTECEEFLALEEGARRRLAADGRSTVEVWMHEECALWAPGLLATGLRVWGLEASVWGARGSRCSRCGRGGAAVACAARGCPARGHVCCARAAHWQLDEEHFHALCPRHR